ncbi:MAG: tRNA (adenosine(37)-N6)-threonylcarbamoyltransferase complex transferase subunit TsaD [Christensenellaceae bacterium]|jgi:N6-L-threonylcarbamoyladenine synthase
MNILAIETSCDETAAAVVKDGREVISEALFSQIDLHKEYGGVVPEIASRNHSIKLPVIVEKAVDGAGGIKNIDAVAVTYGPGLVGALLTGVSFAKGLAYTLGKPLVPVHHIAGHIAANYLSFPELSPPYVCLVVSGGHTQIVHVKEYAGFEILGKTRDDAAGEAIDKVARVLGEPYPGGPNLEKLAQKGADDVYAFPKSFKGESHLDFSFSGLKTAVINLLHKMDQTAEAYKKEDVAASFLKTVVEMLVQNTFIALERTGVKTVTLAGGVAANAQLRQAFEKRAEHEKIGLYIPEMKYCTDNAAMIGSCAYYNYLDGKTAGLDLNAAPVLEL